MHILRIAFEDPTESQFHELVTPTDNNRVLRSGVTESSRRGLYHHKTLLTRQTDTFYYKHNLTSLELRFNIA